MTGGEFLNLVADRRPEREEETAEGDSYARVLGQRTATVLRFIRRDGKPFSMPYALLPIVWGDYLPLSVLIEYHGFFTVRVRGKGLEPLEQLLSERRVTWIRACCDETEAERLPLAVTGIDILRSFHSREVGRSDTAIALLGETEDA